MNEITNGEWMTTTEVRAYLAERYGLRSALVPILQWTVKGAIGKVLPSRRVLGCVMIRKADLEAFLQQPLKMIDVLSHRSRVRRKQPANV